LIYTSCQKSDSDITSTTFSDKLATDADFQQLIILSNDRKKGYSFLDPSNTKEQKDQILSDLKTYSSKNDEYSQLQVLKILGYKSLQEYSFVAKQTSELMQRINEKYPAFKSVSKGSMESIYMKAVKLIQNNLPYRIYPNKNGIASIYRFESLKALQVRKIDCCQAVWNNLQACYTTADWSFFWMTIACGGICSPTFGAGPLAAYACILICEGSAGAVWGSMLDNCTTQATINQYSCPDGGCGL
jgi:hypothetical protein